MKKHSPGCTCCQAKLFTTSAGYAQVLGTTGASGPGGGLIDTGEGWISTFGYDASPSGHDSYPFPYWAKVFGGVEKPVARPGGLSAFIANTFNTFQGAPTMGPPLGIFRDGKTGHFLVNALVLWSYEEGVYHQADPSTFGFGTSWDTHSFRWGSVWYDLTENEFVGEDSGPQVGPIDIPVGAWPWAKRSPDWTPGTGDSLPLYATSSGVKSVVFTGEDLRVLTIPRATPSSGGRSTNGHSVISYAAAKLSPPTGLSVEYEEHTGGWMGVIEEGVIGGSTLVGPGVDLDRTEKKEVVTYTAGTNDVPAGTGKGATREEKTIEAWSPAPGFNEEVVGIVEDQEKSSGNGVVAWSGGSMVNRYLIPGAISPARQGFNFIVNYGENFGQSHLGSVGSTGVLTDDSYFPDFSRAGCFAANGPQCYHIVYARKFSTSVGEVVIDRYETRTVEDWEEVPLENPMIGGGEPLFIVSDFLPGGGYWTTTRPEREFKPVEVEYQVPVLGVHTKPVESVFEFDIQAPLIDEIHQEVLPKDQHAGVFLCVNQSTTGPIPVYEGIKKYQRLTTGGQPPGSNIRPWSNTRPNPTWDGEEYPRKVAAQPMGVLVYSTAKNECYYIARLTGQLVCNYDQYYAQTEGLTPIGVFPDPIDQRVKSQRHVGVTYFGDQPNPFLIFNSNLTEVARLVGDSYKDGHYQLSPAPVGELEERNYPTWGCEGWDGKIYFGTQYEGSGEGGAYRFDPSDLTLIRLYDGRTREEFESLSNVKPKSRRPPGFLSDHLHNVQAYPRNPGTATTPAKTVWRTDFPPLTVE